MDFNFTEEQKALVKMLKDFTKKEVLPKYAHWDRTGEFPFELWKKAADIGLVGMRVAPEYGGLGSDCVTAGLAAEEIAKGDINLTIAVFVVGELTFHCLEKGGTEEVKKEWLVPLVKGEKVPALALTEPHCGTDAAALSSRAIKKGDTYILNGEKSGITMTMAADVAVIFAKTDPAAGAKGVSAFLVPMDSPGITRQSYEDLGMKSGVRGSIFMDDVEVPAKYLLGTEGGGFRMVMNAFDFSRITLALGCLGAAQTSLEETIQYTKERHAFGVPLAKFEGVSFPVAEHYSMIEAIRLLCYRTLWLRDQGLPHTTEAAICKWMAPKYAANAIHDCLLLHGHYGYTQEFPHEQRLRDVIGIEIADGTSQVAKIVIAREIFGREYLPY